MSKTQKRRKMRVFRTFFPLPAHGNALRLGFFNNLDCVEQLVKEMAERK